MVHRYRILDYSNGRIISNLKGTEEACIAMKAVKLYSSSFDVITQGGNEIVTDDFKFGVTDGDWKYSPDPRVDSIRPERLEKDRSQSVMS